jgi:integrase
MVLFMLRSGIRPGELGGLCLKDVNFCEGWIRVQNTFSRKENRYKKTTKNKKFRYVEMNADMRQILLRRRETPPGQPVFNIRMNAIKFFSRTCRLAGVREIHFHALRHTCLTNLANGYGVDRPLPIVKVQQIAGHAEVKTTMRYAHAGGVEDTTSGQWSREQRLAKRENDQNTNPPPGGAEVSTLRVLPNSERPQRKRLQLVK